MNKSIFVSLTSASVLLAACGGGSNQSQAIEADPNDYAALSCEQLATESQHQAQIIASADQQFQEASNANTAGVAVGVLVSPLLGAAMAADSQAKKSELSRKSQQASVEKQAIDIMAKSKNCWK